MATSIDKTVSDRAVEGFTFEKTTGSGESRKVVAKYTLKGMALMKVGEGWKMDPANQGNLATLKGLLSEFPQYAGALLNTYTPVFLRGKLEDGFKGTLRQAVKAACAGKQIVVRSPQFQVISGILANTSGFDPATFPKTAWGPMGFDTPPTAEDVEKVRNGIDPWGPEEEDSEE